MSFFFEYVGHLFENARKGYDKAGLESWTHFLDVVEKDRQRDRILAWRDQVCPDDYAINAGESEYYVRTAGFLWRYKDPTGKHRARDHTYLYNLEVYGHKQYSRRSKADLEKAQHKLMSRVAVGELGPLSPLE